LGGQIPKKGKNQTIARIFWDTFFWKKSPKNKKVTPGKFFGSPDEWGQKVPQERTLKKIGMFGKEPPTIGKLNFPHRGVGENRVSPILKKTKQRNEKVSPQKRSRGRTGKKKRFANKGVQHLRPPHGPTTEKMRWPTPKKKKKKKCSPKNGVGGDPKKIWKKKKALGPQLGKKSQGTIFSPGGGSRTKLQKGFSGKGEPSTFRAGNPPTGGFPQKNWRGLGGEWLKKKKTVNRKGKKAFGG